MLIPDDILDSLLHYMKGVRRFSQILKSLTVQTDSWCPFTHEGVEIDADCYNAHPGIHTILNYCKKYVLCVKFLDGNRYSVDHMMSSVGKLSSPDSLKHFSEFRRVLGEFEADVRFVEPQVMQKLAQMSCQECTRLDEALVCFTNYAFIASVAMAVSAAEVRIIQIIRRKNMRLYDSQFRNATLGQLIQIFDDESYKSRKYASIKKLLPLKHKPLLLLLNQYRIFSVHPKEDHVTPQIAESIMHLSFSFLADTPTCPYTPEELKHAESGSDADEGSS